MSIEAGSAFVTLEPSARGFQAATEKAIGPGIGKAGGSAGRGFGTAFKVAAGTSFAAASVSLGYVLTKGFQRLSAIDQATAKLSGLGHTSAEVSKIMNNALTSVRGTAYGLDEAATVSAAAVASGVKPGKDLERTLRLVADAATIGGSSLSDMGAIFNKVAASNKVQGDVIAQLQDQGIPIVQFLGKALNKTASEVYDMSAAGTISFATFRKAMEQGLGGAALKSADSFTGSLANVRASLSRIGAGVLGGAFPALAPGLRGVTAALAPLETQAAAIGQKIGVVLAPAIANLGPYLTNLVTSLGRVDFTKVGDGFQKMASGSGSLGPALAKLGNAFKDIDFGTLGGAAVSGVSDTISVFSVVVGFAADHVDTLAQVLPGIVVAFAAYKTAQAAANVVALANVPITAAQVVSNFALARANNALAAQLAITNGVENISLLTRARTTVATVAATTVGLAAAAATKVMAAGQWLLNAALLANPIGIVVVAIAALVAGLIYAYKHSETFRNIVNSAFGAVRGFITAVMPAVVGAVVGGVRRVVSAWRTVTGIVGTVRAAFGAAVGAIRAKIGGAVGAVKSLISRIKGAFNGLVGAMSGIGGHIIGGLVSGIRAAAGRVASAVASVVNKIPKKVRQIMGIASPSKVMHQLGLYAGEGFTNGLSASLAKSSATLDALQVSGVSPRSLAVSSVGAGGLLGSGGTLSMDGARFTLVLDDGTPLTGYVRAIADDSVASVQSLASQGRRF